MKGVQLITALGEFTIEESVEEMVKRKNAVPETGDIEFTVLNTIKGNESKYKASIIAGLYRGVREVELVEKKKEQKTDK